MFDDLHITQLRKMSESILEKLASEKTISTEEQLTLVLYGLNNHYHTLEGNVLAEIKEMHLDMDRRFEQVEKHFEQVEIRIEKVDSRFERVYTFLYWMVGTLLAAMGLGFASLAIFK